MRVAIVNSLKAFGGGEHWVLQVAGGLRRRGHDVAVVARAGSRLLDRAGDEGHTTLALPMRSDFDPASIVRLASWLAGRRVDLVAAIVERAVRIGAIGARLAGIRAVVERKGLELPLKATRRHRWVHARLVSHLIVNCDAIARSVIEAGLVPRSGITVIRNVIDPETMVPEGGAALRRELGIPPDAPLVSMVSRLVPDKGHRDALAAFEAVRATIPDARLLIAGGGKLRGELERLASRVGPPGTVILAGHRDDVGAVLDASDVLLVSSYREGTPRMVLEAMTARVPVVATSVSGIPEMIVSGRDGLLVPVGDPAAAAAGLVRVLTEPALAEALAASARRRVEDEFTLESMIDRVEALFEREIAELPPRGRRAVA